MAYTAAPQGGQSFLGAASDTSGEYAARTSSTKKRSKSSGMPSDDEILRTVDAKLVHAYGGDQDTTLSTDRARLINDYLGLNTNPAPEERSQVVDRTVFQTVQTILPSLVRIFASTNDEVCKFMPVGPDDEAAADQTSAYINWIATQKNPWEQLVADWIFDALLLRNSYAMAYWCDEAESTEERYEGQSDDQLAMMAQDPDVQITQHTAKKDPEYVPPPPQIDPMTGMPAPQPPTPQIHDLVITRNTGKGHIKLCVLPPEHCIIDGDCPNWMLRECDYFEYREEKTIASLKASGLDVTDDISDATDNDERTRTSLEDLARDRLGEQRQLGDAGTGGMRKVMTRMVWVRVAPDTDDEAKMIYAIIVGRTVLYAEQVNRICVSSMTPQPLPHRHPGMSYAEIVTDIQNIKTAIKRGALDNLYLSNNGRHVISDQVNVEDFLDSRPGGVVRLRNGVSNPQLHVMPLTHPFVFDSVVSSMEYFDEDAQNRSGASRYFSGTDAGAINRTASGISQLTNQSAQRVEHIARMMAPAFEDLFSIIHELVSKHQNKPDIIKIRGQWTSVDPSAWYTKRDVRISVGVGAGNKDNLLNQLGMMFQQQMMMGQMGLTNVVQPGNVYQTLMEQAKLMGFSNPEKFWTDPKTVPPQQPPPPPELIKIQAQMQDKDKQRAFDAQQNDLNRRLDAWKTQVTAGGEHQLEQARIQNDQVKTALDARDMHHSHQMDQINAKMDAMGVIHQAHTSAQQANQHAQDAQVKAGEAQKAHDELQHLAQIHKAIEGVKEHVEGVQTDRAEKLRDPTGKLIGARVHQRNGKTREVRFQ